MGDFDLNSGLYSLPSGLDLNLAFVMILEVLTWSTLSSQQASLSRHLIKGMFNLYPSEFINSLLSILMTPPMYLAPLSVVR